MQIPRIIQKGKEETVITGSGRGMEKLQDSKFRPIFRNSYKLQERKVESAADC